MKPRMSIPKPPVHRILFLQTLSTVLFAASLLFWDTAAAFSALLGGTIATVGNTYFAWRAFHYNGTRHASKVVSSFYRAEIGKFFVMAVLMAVVFKWVEPLNKATLLLAFALILLIATVGAAFLLQPTQMTTGSREEKVKHGK